MIRSRYPFQLILMTILATVSAAASFWYMHAAPGLVCTTLTPLTILATISAFLISICFRLMARFKQKAQRWFLLVCVLVAAATLITDFRYVRHFRDRCDQIQPQMELLR